MFYVEFYIIEIYETNSNLASALLFSTTSYDANSIIPRPDLLETGKISLDSNINHDYNLQDNRLSFNLRFRIIEKIELNFSYIDFNTNETIHLELFNPYKLGTQPIGDSIATNHINSNILRLGSKFKIKESGNYSYSISTDVNIASLTWMTTLNTNIGFGINYNNDNINLSLIPEVNIANSLSENTSELGEIETLFLGEKLTAIESNLFQDYQELYLGISFDWTIKKFTFSSELVFFDLIEIFNGKFDAPLNIGINYQIINNLNLCLRSNFGRRAIVYGEGINSINFNINYLIDVY